MPVVPPEALEWIDALPVPRKALPPWQSITVKSLWPSSVAQRDHLHEAPGAWVGSFPNVSWR